MLKKLFISLGVCVYAVVLWALLALFFYTHLYPHTVLAVVLGGFAVIPVGILVLAAFCGVWAWVAWLRGEQW